jgi:hypothetical protein
MSVRNAHVGRARSAGSAKRSVSHAGGAATTTLLVVLVLCLHAAIWWTAIAWYPDLPDRLPMHFDAAGEPDRFAPKSVGAWFLLPGIALGMLVFLGAVSWGIGALVRSSPGLCNVPRKDVFLRLSPEGRLAVAGPVRRFLLATLVIFQGMFVWMVEGSARVAVGDCATLASWPVLVCVGAVLGLLWPFYRSTGKAIERQARREGVVG